MVGSQSRYDHILSSFHAHIMVISNFKILYTFYIQYIDISHIDISNRYHEGEPISLFSPIPAAQMETLSPQSPDPELEYPSLPAPSNMEFTDVHADGEQTIKRRKVESQSDRFKTVKPRKGRKKAAKAAPTKPDPPTPGTNRFNGLFPATNSHKEPNPRLQRNLHKIQRDGFR